MRNYYAASWSFHGSVHITSLKVVPFVVEVSLQSFVCNILVLILDTMFCTLVTYILELLWGLQLAKKNMYLEHTGMTTD